MRPLEPVWGTRAAVASIFRYSWNNRAEFLGVIVSYLLVLFALNIAVFGFFVVPFWLEEDGIEPVFFAWWIPGFILVNWLFFYVHSFIAINWCRLVVNGSDTYEHASIWLPKKDELKFVLAAFVALTFPVAVIIFGMKLLIDLAFYSYVGGGVVAFSFFAAYFLVLFFLCYSICKTSFYLCAKACGHDFSLWDSFVRSKGYCLKMVGALMAMTVSWGLTTSVYFLPVMLTTPYIAEWAIGSGENDSPLVLLCIIWIPMVPSFLLFQPATTMMYMAIFANYYLYAKQEWEEDISGCDTIMVYE